MGKKHSMDLREFARLSGRGKLPLADAAVVVIAPVLAEALDDLLRQATLEREQLAPDDPFTVALDAVQALHDFERVRLGGRPIDPPPPASEAPDQGSPEP